MKDRLHTPAPLYVNVKVASGEYATESEGSKAR